jgi:transcription factor SPT20 homolog
VTRERLHTLVINLYPGNKGYSLAFRPATSTPSSSTSSNHRTTHHHHHTSPIGEIETPSWLYDNAHLLDALDSEELPPLIIDFCNIHCPHLYYNGAVIAQIRDYRQSYPLDICDKHYVLLKPTATALWDEINGVVDSSWSAKERTAFESAIVLATAPPMCLDPSPSIGIAAINATTESQPFAIEEVRRCARKFLQVTKNRNNKLEKKTHYQQTELASHLAIERRGINQSRREIIRPLRAHRKRQCMLIDGIDMNPNMKFVDTIAPSRSYDWQPRNVERVTLKTDRDSTQYRVIVDLSQRATSCELVGELSLERQTTKVGQQINNNHNNAGRKQMCPFKLSSPLAARRYVKEFIGIFTEEGRKCVEIVHEKEMKTGREVKQWMTGTGEKIQPLISTVPKPQTSLPTSSTSIINPNPQPQQQQQQQLQLIQQQQQQQQTQQLQTPPPALKITAAPQRLIATAQMTQPKQLVVLTQVKQEPSGNHGNQVIKKLLNQPHAPLNFPPKQQTPTPSNIVANGHSSIVPVFLQVDQSNLIHMGSGNLQVSFKNNE